MLEQEVPSQDGAIDADLQLRADHADLDERPRRERQVAGRIAIDQEVGVDGLVGGVDFHLHASAGQSGARQADRDGGGGARSDARSVEQEVALAIRHRNVGLRRIAQAQVKVRHGQPDDCLPGGGPGLLDHEITTHDLSRHRQFHARPLTAEDLRRISRFQEKAIEPDQFQPLRVPPKESRGFGGQRDAGEARRIMDGCAAENLVEFADHDRQLVLQRGLAVLQGLLALRLHPAPQVIGHRVGARDQLRDQRGRIGNIPAVEQRRAEAADAHVAVGGAARVHRHIESSAQAQVRNVRSHGAREVALHALAVHRQGNRAARYAQKLGRAVAQPELNARRVDRHHLLALARGLFKLKICRQGLAQDANPSPPHFGPHVGRAPGTRRHQDIVGPDRQRPGSGRRVEQDGHVAADREGVH